MPYHFGPFRLDLDNATLLQGEDPLPLQPKTFDLLVHLVRHAGELVSKDDLMETVWPDTIVSDSVLTASMSELHKVLGEMARKPQYIGTVHRRGYRFIAPVVAEPLEPSAAAEVATRPRAELKRRPHGTMVAREAELTQLHERLDQALQGHRQVVFITGEAGIGKTTLVDAFVDQIASSGAIRIGRGQCIEHYGAGEPYLPLLEALGRLGKGPDGTCIKTVLHHHAPSWLLQLPSLVTDAELEMLQRRASGGTRERMLRELAEAMEALTMEQALVLVLEDLHWSDPAALNGLALIAHRRTPAQRFVLGTYRPVDAMVRQHPSDAALGVPGRYETLDKRPQPASDLAEEPEASSAGTAAAKRAWGRMECCQRAQGAGSRGRLQAGSRLVPAAGQYAGRVPGPDWSVAVLWRPV
ncbi:winged helix-turn-helix domain-containing protein [Candidatus Entotheonella palauensis]|uniref:winged helix-turn-helix domain-containing protein n=1 Tax=Candidatus Entotheonella palauensis TaxID=93172 RepID=UPI000B7D5A78|nr:AAA family ATPase [Candidatus Entotheonella palauensis]